MALTLSVFLEADKKFTMVRNGNHLTERQLQIVRLVAQGHSKKSIGQPLGISAGSVRNTLAEVYSTVGHSSRAYVAALYASEAAKRISALK